MFNSNPKKTGAIEIIEKRENIETSIGSQCIIKGQLENPSSLQFHGHIEGSIICGDYLVICKEAIVDGDIEADTAVMYGSLTGSIRADKVELKKTAQINGDIETYSFDLETGAFFNGRIKMLKTEEKISKPRRITTRSDLAAKKELSDKSIAESPITTADTDKTVTGGDGFFVGAGASIFDKKK